MPATVRSNRTRRLNAKRQHKHTTRLRRLRRQLGRKTGKRHSSWK